MQTIAMQLVIIVLVAVSGGSGVGVGGLIATQFKPSKKQQATISCGIS